MSYYPEDDEVFLTQETLDARDELGWDDEPLPSNKDWIDPKSMEEARKSVAMAKRISADPATQANIATIDLLFNRLIGE